MTATRDGLLVPCPLCGEDKGYTLHEGSTYRWWWVRCAACGSDLAECSSDRRTVMGQPLPERWPSADTAWNEQGRHAHQLRAALDEADRIMAHDDAATEWREKWAGLWANRSS